MRRAERGIPVHMDEPRTEEFHDRLARRTRRGLLIGFFAGLLIGIVIGAIAGGGRVSSILMWSMLSLAGLVIGGIWGGFGGLENPDAGAEPTQSPEPLHDAPVTQEHDPPLGR
jgi:hypothetical protein